MSLSNELESDRAMVMNLESFQVGVDGVGFFLESSFITHSTGRRPALARRPPQGP
jgi:hypothetical protein